ncbi:hypothetical protein ARTHRO9AX_160006 [Arthrobacter sp. 9AX]|nr:hypothetical protein ARTHRO9AX_160006 [Arthrobacter sp. 9AX]
MLFRVKAVASERPELLRRGAALLQSLLAHRGLLRVGVAGLFRGRQRLNPGQSSAWQVPRDASQELPRGPA